MVEDVVELEAGHEGLRIGLDLVCHGRLAMLFVFAGKLGPGTVELAKCCVYGGKEETKKGEGWRRDC